MTAKSPKEKATYLLEIYMSGYETKDGFDYMLNNDESDAKHMVLIALENEEETIKKLLSAFGKDNYPAYEVVHNMQKELWEVKKELELL